MAGSMVSSSSKSDLVVASRRGNGLFKVAKWAMGIAAVGGAISGNAFATEIAQQQPEQKGDVIEPKGEQEKEVKSSGIFSFGNKSKKQDPFADHPQSITKTSNTEKTELKDLSMTVGKAERWLLGFTKLEKIEMGPIKKFIFDTIAGMTKYNPGNANFGLSEYTIKTLNKNDIVEIPEDIVQQLDYLLHHRKDRDTVDLYTRHFAYWFAHKLMTEGLGSAPKDKDARKLWNANFKALKYHVLMSIPDEYKSGSKVKASKKDETEKAKKAEEVKKVEEVEKAEEVETVSENAQ